MKAGHPGGHRPFHCTFARVSRGTYLDLIERGGSVERAVRRPALGCANLAHAYAGTRRIASS